MESGVVNETFHIEHSGLSHLSLHCAARRVTLVDIERLDARINRDELNISIALYLGRKHSFVCHTTTSRLH